MDRSLSLILNGRESSIMSWHDVISLDLETMKAKDLDAYISKNFNSSDEVRKKYADKINPFLEQHKGLIEKVEKSNGRKYNGSIVVTEFHDDLTIERKKVIYKKDMILFREITNNKEFILVLENRDYINYQSALKNKRQYNRIFSEYFGKELRFYCFSESKFRRIMGQWRNAIKQSLYYYDIVREILKEYQNRYKDLGLDSLDVIYSKYLDNKSRKTSDDLQEELDFLGKIQDGEIFEQDLLMHMSDYEEPKRYPKIYDEEGYPGDLEDHSAEGHYSDDEIKEYSHIPDYCDDNDLEEQSKDKTKIKTKTQAQNDGFEYYYTLFDEVK